MIIPYGTPVSPALERALDGLTGLDGRPNGTLNPPAAASDYPQFIGFNGCYYGKYHASGRWFLQYCNRYTAGQREAVASPPRIGHRRGGSQPERRAAP